MPPVTYHLFIELLTVKDVSMTILTDTLNIGMNLIHPTSLRTVNVTLHIVNVQEKNIFNFLYEKNAPFITFH